MRVVIADISGKVTNYDVALVKALNNQEGASKYVFMAPRLRALHLNFPHRSLLTLVPEKYANSEGKLKRYVKAIEGCLNYVYLVAYCIVHRVDVLHLQWLPFLEFNSIEIPLLRCFKKLFRRCKMVLTVHNIYPHDMSAVGKEKYKERMKSASGLFDGFIVHTKNSRTALFDEFGIDQDSVDVIHHGIFAPKDLQITPNVSGGKWHFILYGNQSPYKGTDIFLDAVQSLPPVYKDKIKITIAGKIGDDYLQLLKEKSYGLCVDWMSFFVPDAVLYQKILESNVIVLPYRQISQSGVLLLALHFRRYLLVSNLPSFRETLDGFLDDMFFENGNPTSLADRIKAYMDGEVNLEEQKDVIEELNRKYSWSKAAEMTKQVYNR